MKLKDKFSKWSDNFFYGADGSIIWLIKQIIQFIKDVVRAINDWNRARYASREAEKRLANQELSEFSTSSDVPKTPKDVSESDE